MYQNYSQHSELNRLIGAVAVSKRFCQSLFQRPVKVLKHGCLGYQFDLTAAEAELVTRAVAVGDVQKFSLQVWEWMGCNGRGEASPQTAEHFGGALVGTGVSTAPVKEKYDRLLAEGLTPIRRWGQPSDVGRAAVALVRGDFPFSTGEVLNVDGGFHLRRL